MSEDIKKFFQAKDNLESVSTIVFMMAKNNFGVELDGNFTPILLKTMEDNFSKFGKKPKNTSAENHIKNLNKLVIDDCLKWVQQNYNSGVGQIQQNFQNNMQNLQNNNMMQGINNSQSGMMQMQRPNYFPPNGPDPSMNPQNFTLNVSTGQMGAGGGGQPGMMQPNMMQPGMMQPGMMQPGMMQPGMGQNPFLQQNSFGNQNGADLSSLVDNLAYQRGYNMTQNQAAPPKVDFTMPMTQHGTDPNFVMQKLQEERQYFNNMQRGQGAMNLNELIGNTQQGQQNNMIQNRNMQQNIPNNNTNNPNLQNYMQHLQQNRQKGDVLDQMLREQENAKYGRNNSNNGNEGQHGQEDLNSEYYQRLNNMKKFNGGGDDTDQYTNMLNGYNGDDNSNVNHHYNQNPYNDNSNNNYSNNNYSQQQNGGESYLSLDLRQDLRDIEGNKYCVSFGGIGNIAKIELVSCSLTRNEYLDGEPYIYLNIDEIEGNYGLSNGLRVFGKLYPEKEVGDFIEYRSEKCLKSFQNPTTLHQMTLSFLKFNQKSVPLHGLGIKKIIKQTATNRLKIITKAPHYLSLDEEVNFSVHDKHQISVDSLKVLEIVDDRTFIVDNIYEQLSSNVSLERKNIKCSLTFRVSFF